MFQKHPFFFFFLTTFKALIAWSYQLPQPGAPKSLRMILPWAVCGVKKYDLPKSESVTEAEMEPRSGHSGVLLMVLISTFFSVAMPHSDLFCCVNVLKKKKWKVGVWAVEKFARKHLKLCLLAYIGPEWSSLHWGYLSNYLTDSYTARHLFYYVLQCCCSTFQQLSVTMNG